MVKTLILLQYSKTMNPTWFKAQNPCRKQKIHRKKQKILAINLKTHKIPIYTLLFLVKKGQIMVIFWKKREKTEKKVKKGKFLKIDFAESTQKHQKNCQNDLLKPSPPDFSAPILRKCVKDPRKSAANLINLMKFPPQNYPHFGFTQTWYCRPIPQS